MFHKVKSVNALPDFVLSVQFSEGITKTYDVKMLFERWPAFEKLKADPGYFDKVKVDLGGYGIIWDDYLDLSCDELFENGKVVKTPSVIDRGRYLSLFIYVPVQLVYLLLGVLRLVLGFEPLPVAQDGQHLVRHLFQGVRAPTDVSHHPVRRIFRAEFFGDEGGELFLIAAPHH